MLRPKCTKCNLCHGATHVKVKSRGTDTPTILFVGEAPGPTENANGICFTGRAGKGLDRFIDQSGIDPGICRWSNIVRCIPWADNGASFRKPTDPEIDACFPHLEDEILATNPVFIVPLGNTALHAIIPSAPMISKARGNRYYLELPTLKARYRRVIKWVEDSGFEPYSDCSPLQVPNSYSPVVVEKYINTAKEYGYEEIEPRTFTIFPTFHPSAAIRGNKDIELLIVQDLTYLAFQVYGNTTIPFDNYAYLDSLEKIKDAYDVVNDLFDKGEIDSISIDLETNGLNPYTLPDPKVLLWSISYGEGKAFTVPYQHRMSPFVNDSVSLRAISAMTHDLFQKIPAVNQNIKFDLHWMYLIDIWPKEIAGDSFLASWTLWNDTVRHSLEELATNHIGMISHKEEMHSALEEAALSVPEPTMDDIDIDITHRYCCADADSALRLHKYFTQLMYRDNLLKPHNEICIPAIIPVANIERTGIRVDLELLKKAEVEFEDRMQETYNQLNEWGYGSSILRRVNRIATEKAIAKGKNPPKTLKSVFGMEKAKDSVQLTAATKSILLFDILGFTPLKVGKTGPSTDKHVLADLLEQCMSSASQGNKQDREYWDHRYDVVNMLRKFSADQKMYTSYIKPIPLHVDKNSVIHTQFGIRTTRTGRFNCRNPSLHIFPWKSLAKQAICPHHEHGLIVSADFSQMELRVLASVTRDEGMMAAFRNNEDIHRKVASLVLGKPMDQVLSAERRRIKAVVFGIVFERTAMTIAAQEKIPVSEAEGLMDEFFRMFPEVARWRKNQHKLVKRDNFVLSPFGFRRIMDDFLKDAEKERRAVNTPIQGSASDIGCISLTNVYYLLQKRPKLLSTQFGFVHDSQLFSVYPTELWDVCAIALKGMKTMPEQRVTWMRVPLKVDFEIGPSWGQLTEASILPGRRVEFEDCKPEYHDIIEAKFSKWDPQPILVKREDKEVLEDGSEIYQTGSAMKTREAQKVKTISSIWEFPKIPLI